ncbi:MAG: GTPase HflX [Clostridiales bacterium]|nr:GTPase HflX [Clostridiales bacterium]
MADYVKEKYFKTDDIQEKVILVGISSGEEDDTKASLEELGELARTAGAVVLGCLIQNRESPHPGTYLGKGKIEELAQLIASLGADGVICDDELSPAQMANLEDALGAKVMDQTLLILDIFAQRASTREGKIQVELAQLRYRATRLVGLGRSLSRLGGGIGTRGPGENKLEMDRRLIKDRISHLKKELDEVKCHREVARKQRSKNPVPVAAIVGYTNAGKSTLLNTLTNAGVLEEDKLFATLDPTTRNLSLESGQQILLTDTVGFIRKLPHHLINAFRSTLEEARYADMIIHVVDASNPQMDAQMHVVYDTLRQLEIRDKTIITAFNKMDIVRSCGREEYFKDFSADHTVYISANDRNSLRPLLETIEKVLREQKVFVEKLFDYKDAGKIAVIRKFGQLLEEEYTDEGIRVKAYVPSDVYAMLQNG